jgi:hypothetical protein
MNMNMNTKELLRLVAKNADRFTLRKTMGEAESEMIQRIVARFHNDYKVFAKEYVIRQILKYKELGETPNEVAILKTTRIATNKKACQDVKIKEGYTSGKSILALDYSY